MNSYYNYTTTTKYSYIIKFLLTVFFSVLIIFYLINKVININTFNMYIKITTIIILFVYFLWYYYFNIGRLFLIYSYLNLEIYNGVCNRNLFFKLKPAQESSHSKIVINYTKEKRFKTDQHYLNSCWIIANYKLNSHLKNFIYDKYITQYVIKLLFFTSIYFSILILIIYYIKIDKLLMFILSTIYILTVLIISFFPYLDYKSDKMYDDMLSKYIKNSSIKDFTINHNFKIYKENHKNI